MAENIQHQDFSLLFAMWTRPSQKMVERDVALAVKKRLVVASAWEYLGWVAPSSYRDLKAMVVEIERPDTTGLVAKAVKLLEKKADGERWLSQMSFTNRDQLLLSKEWAALSEAANEVWQGM